MPVRRRRRSAQGTCGWYITIALGLATVLAARAEPTRDVATKSEKNGRTDPTGVSLELVLTSRKDIHRLELGGKTAKEFRAFVERLSHDEVQNPYSASAVAGRYPQTPQVELTVELRVTGDQPVALLFDRRSVLYGARDKPEEIVFGGGRYLALEVVGPGALAVVNQSVTGPKWDAEGYEPITLQPKTALRYSYHDLRYGPPYRDRPEPRNRIYWTELGEYSLRAVLETAVSISNGRVPARVYSNWVRVRVVESNEKKTR